MAIVHGWKAFSVIEEQGANVLMDEVGGHLHSAISAEDSPSFDSDNGHSFYHTVEGAFQDTPSAYAHITGMGKTILHVRGGRTAQYSVDYFLPAPYLEKLAPIAEELNIAIIPGEEGCPFCRTKHPTDEAMLAWMGEGYER